NLYYIVVDYWDSVSDWNGVNGLLNTTLSEVDGSYEVWVTVPESVAGYHYLWAKDESTGDTSRSGPITVSSPLPPIPMLVYGTVYFDAVPAGAGVAVYAKEGTTELTSCLTSA
ncbi:unnamed protein product, partial [marine sediment metagenome]